MTPNGSYVVIGGDGCSDVHRGCADRARIDAGTEVNAPTSMSAAIVEAERVRLWDNTILWNAVQKWNAAVALNASEEKASSPLAGVIPRYLRPVDSPSPRSLPISGDYHDWPDWRLWHAVGLCEQRGDGPDGIAWHGSPAGGLPGSGYPGGLGLSRDFWNEFAPLAGVTVTNGAEASPGEQIRVARAGSHDGTRMGGWSSWTSGCVQRTEAKL